jgi:hypothetical protein
MLRPHRSALQAQHDPEKWEPVFGQDHAQGTSMITKDEAKDHAQTSA